MTSNTFVEIIDFKSNLYTGKQILLYAYYYRYFELGLLNSTNTLQNFVSTMINRCSWWYELIQNSLLLQTSQNQKFLYTSRNLNFKG